MMTVILFLVSVFQLLGASFLIPEEISPDTKNTDQATIYIMRSYDNATLKQYNFFIDQNFEGKLNHNKYLEVTLDPGSYLFWVRGDRFSYLEANVEAGKTYVIDAVVTSGKWWGNVALTPVSEGDSKVLSKLKSLIKLGYVENTPEEDKTIGPDKYRRTIAKALSHYNEIIASGSCNCTFDNYVDLDNVQYLEENLIDEDKSQIAKPKESDNYKGIYKNVQEIPLFGGLNYSGMNDAQKKVASEKQIIKHISKNLKYPKKARKNKTQGRIFVRFIINTDGSISNIEVVRDIGDGCGEEAIKMLKKFPKWIPGKENGKPVRVMYTLPLTFILEEESEKQKNKKADINKLIKV